MRAWHDELGGLADPREELLVYQTLAGALPIERERLDGYLEKALREGKVNTNWLTPNEEHERTVQEYAWRAAALSRAIRSSSACARSAARWRSRSSCSS